MKLIFLSEKLR